MTMTQWIVLAIIQGITEFLPISSSAHLILPSHLFGWPDQGLAFDVAVHVGSLLAVIIYFRQLIVQIVVNCLKAIGRQEHDRGTANLGWMVVIATIPAVIVGFLAESFIENHLRSILVIAVTTSVFGLVDDLWPKTSGSSGNIRNIHSRPSVSLVFAKMIRIFFCVRPISY